MRLLDTDHPFFRPLWIRVLIVVFCAAWGAFEIFMGSVGWAIVFLAIGAYAAWGFFVEFNPRVASGEANENDAGKE